MSFILDALNRSDNDRSPDQDVPGIQSMHGPGAFAAAPLWKRLLWPVIALGFALVAVVAWWSGQRTVPEPPAAVVAAPVQPAAQPEPVVQAPAAAVPQAPAADAPAPDASAPDAPAPARDKAREADIAALYRDAPARAAPPPDVAQPQPEVPAPQPASPPAPAPAEPALDVDTLARAAQAELDSLQTTREPVVEHAAPFVNELRQSVKDDIPSVFYNAHNWSRDPRQRSVILNKREFREGQQVKPGLRLVEILEDGIVLDFRGTEFRLRSLNSWVNL